MQRLRHIRYIVHRPGKDREKITRTLFGNDGALTRLDAYRMIDEAEKATHFFRMVISPDPEQEDKGKDLNLWDITDKIMLSLEERLQKQVAFIAAEHNDHSSKRHVHAVALVRGRIDKDDLQALRRRATEAALFQRKERDLAQEHKAKQREREEAQWERGY